MEMKLSADIGTLISYGIALGAFCFGLFLSIKQAWKKRKAKKENKNDPLLMLERDLLIQDVLTELRVNLNADRVYVSKFHNGGEYFDGIKIKKISRTHESCSRGVSHENVSFQNVPLSMIPDVMMILHQSVQVGKPVVRCSNSLSSGFLKNHLDSLNIKLFVKHRISVGMRMIGYLGVQYEDDNKELSEDDLNLIIDACGRVENIMTTEGSYF